MTTPDSYMDGLKHPEKPLIEALCGVVRALDPQVVEIVKWNAPSFVYDGKDFATLHLRAKRGIGLILHTGVKAKDHSGFAPIDDPQGLLKWLAADRAMISFDSLETLKAGEAVLTAILRQWLTRL
ncbi:DUF1801 domain-containing protein [Asticcacaulis sp. YBE204]|uniref:DUF1801 domain-containing protein n=1 Tax=Asticcacaulis sp. YBE204 TaxID=1282363 RepID=UPI0003C3EB46|nr:DUF1801 domain-containing protein [Asticcacaulis sp. YBE204]ESQ78802.1 hypothetical protein AEYBE204_12525 [Asticcacaulis sp. YBE204]